MTLPKLPSKPTMAEREAYVGRILSQYAAATCAQVAQGAQWYPSARVIAAECGDVRTGAGILAALSANKGWAENVRLARLAFGGTFGGHFADALTKARRIAAGTDPADVLPMGLKTGQFYRCIADPWDPDAVVIDRHAHDVVAGMKYGNGERGLDVPSRYASIADAYREAGQRLSMVPSRIQAIVWVRVTDLARNSRILTGVPGWGVA